MVLIFRIFFYCHDRSIEARRHLSVRLRDYDSKLSSSCLDETVDLGSGSVRWHISECASPSGRAMAIVRVGKVGRGGNRA